MNLRENLENHPLVVVFAIVVISSGITWTIANELLVKPRDFHINVLRAENDNLKKNLQHLPVSHGESDSLAGPAPMFWNTQLADQAAAGDFSPLSIREYFEVWYDHSMTDLQRGEFENSVIGKRVVWEGTVSSIKPGSDERILLTLEDKMEGRFTAFFYFEKDQREELLRLQPNQHIKVSGRIRSIIDSPFLYESRVLQILDIE